jgi:hypothetical protein
MMPLRWYWRSRAVDSAVTAGWCRPLHRKVCCDPPIAAPKLDGGATFARVGLESGLPPAAVNDIQINPASNRTVMFTYGRGAFELAR